MNTCNAEIVMESDSIKKTAWQKMLQLVDPSIHIQTYNLLSGNQVIIITPGLPFRKKKRLKHLM